MYSASQVADILRSVGFDPLSISEPNDVEDGCIQFIGWHLSVGFDYVCAVEELPDGKLLFHPSVSTVSQRSLIQIAKELTSA